MANALPKLLTKRKQAHILISQLQQLHIRYQGWREAKQALKAYRRSK